MLYLSREAAGMMLMALPESIKEKMLPSVQIGMRSAPLQGMSPRIRIAVTLTSSSEDLPDLPGGRLKNVWLLSTRTCSTLG